MNTFARAVAWTVVLVGFLIAGALLLAIIGLILYGLWLALYSMATADWIRLWRNDLFRCGLVLFVFYGYAWLWSRCWEWLKQQKKVKA